MSPGVVAEHKLRRFLLLFVGNLLLSKKVRKTPEHLILQGLIRIRIDGLPGGNEPVLLLPKVSPEVLHLLPLCKKEEVDTEGKGAGEVPCVPDLLCLVQQCSKPLCKAGAPAARDIAAGVPAKFGVCRPAEGIKVVGSYLFLLASLLRHQASPPVPGSPACRQVPIEIRGNGATREQGGAVPPSVPPCPLNAPPPGSGREP